MKPSLASVAVVLLAGCQSDYETVEKKKVLDSFTYVDCGAIAPGTRQVCTVPLFSEGAGPVTIFDIVSVDMDYPEGGLDPDAGTSFIVRDEDWMSPDCTSGNCLELAAYDDESDDDTLALPVTFAPNAEGEYRAEITIWSNDTESLSTEPLPDDPADEKTVWKVQVRALARPACGRIYPPFLDMGYRNAGGAEFHEDATLENCGIVPLVVSSFHSDGTGASQMTITNPLEITVLPGNTEVIDVAWSVPEPTDTDGDGQSDDVTASETVFSFEPEELNLDPLTVIANDCENSALSDWDDDGDGWLVCAGDCDDTDPTANPSEVERSGNEQDDNCDGEIDETANPVGTDDDGDGYTETAGDCDDLDPLVSPGATEAADGVDEDCDGTIDDTTERYDDDRDGFSEREGDSDDDNRLVYPGATETTDGVDNDGDGIIDEGGPEHDDDQDGQTDLSGGGTDCDDDDTWTHDGAFEFCDGYDNDCDGEVDEGEDDVADGACAFLPRRVADTVAPAKPTGCAAVGTDGLGTVLVAAGLGLAGLRRRRSRR